MHDFFIMCLIVCPLVFLGAFVDAVAGGGGIITLPAYLLAGLPAHMAIGTNKIASCCGSVTASVKYFLSGKVLLRVALFSAGGSILGGILGSELALYIPEDTLKLLIMVILPIVAVFLTLKRDFGMNQKVKSFSKPMESCTALAIGFFVGCYDGLIGPGAGTFLILCFSGIMGLDLLTAGGCAKVSNMASNLGSVIVFLRSGDVMVTLAVPAAICSIVGSYLGSRFAIKGGSKRIRSVMFLVLILLFVKMIYDYFWG